MTTETIERQNVVAAEDRDEANHELNGEAAADAADQPASDQAAAVPATPPPSPEELRRRHYDECRVLNRHVGEAFREWQAAKSEAAELKKGYDGLVQQLRKTLDRDPLQRDLLDEPAKAVDGENPWHDPSDRQFTGPAPNDAWKKVPIAELGLSKSLTSKLEHHDLETLGQLQEFWDAKKDLKDLKQIGEESAAKIIDAFADYGVQHRELWESPEAEPAAELEVAEGDDLNAEDDPSLG